MNRWMYLTLFCVCCACGGNELPKKEAETGTDGPTRGDLNSQRDLADEDSNRSAVGGFRISRVDVSGPLTDTTPVIIDAHVEHPDGMHAITATSIHIDDVWVATFERADGYFRAELDWWTLNSFVPQSFESSAAASLVIAFEAGMYQVTHRVEVPLHCGGQPVCMGLCGLRLCEDACASQCGTTDPEPPVDPEPDPEPEGPDSDPGVVPNWLQVSDHCFALPTGDSNDWSEARLEASSPIWERPWFCPGTPDEVEVARYQAYRFCNETGARGVWSFDLYPIEDINGLTASDPYLTIYDAPLPVDPLACAAADDDGGDGFNSRIVYEIPAGGSVVVMMSSRDADDDGGLELHIREVD